MVWWVEPAPPGFVLDSPTYLSDLHERPSCSGSEPSVLLHSLSFDTSRASRKLTLSFVPSLAYILLHLGFLWQALRAQWSKLFTGFARIERPCCFCSRIDSRREALKCPLKGKKRRSNCPATVERAISLEILFSEKKHVIYVHFIQSGIARWRINANSTSWNAWIRNQYTQQVVLADLSKWRRAILFKPRDSFFKVFVALFIQQLSKSLRFKFDEYVTTCLWHKRSGRKRGNRCESGRKCWENESEVPQWSDDLTGA